MFSSKEFEDCINVEKNKIVSAQGKVLFKTLTVITILQFENTKCTKGVV